MRIALPASIDAANFNAVRVMQFENGTWNDKTTDTPPRDFSTRIIYARLTTLSPIAAVSPLGPVVGTASISGRIQPIGGRSTSGAVISANPTTGPVATNFANPFGFYRINGLTIGQNYVIRGTSKRRRLAPPRCWPSSRA